MNLKTVIVDDNDVVIFLHETMLADSKLSSSPRLSAVNGQLALDIIKEHIAEDVAFLVLLDINMPVMDGWQFLDALHSFPEPLPVHVVMVTSSVNYFDKQKATKYPSVLGFYQKPLSDESCLEISNMAQLQPFLN